MARVSMLLNKRVGQVQVISRTDKKGGMDTWDCLCDCGKSFVAFGNALREHLKVGCTVYSCGCHRKTADNDTTSGSPYNRLYRIWAGMLSRCNNPNRLKYKNYGARGIKVEFANYKEFKKWSLASGYTDTMSIERKDVNGNYSVTNCCWIPLEDQKYNKTNIKLTNLPKEVLINLVIEAKKTYGGMRKLAKELGCTYEHIWKTHRRYTQDA